MKAVILNGARPTDAISAQVNALLLQELARIGWDVQPFTLRDAKIAYCQGDFECWVKTPGICKADDDSREIARAVINGDVAIFLTPITFGGYSSELKRALDKMICLISPFFKTINGEVHHHKRYDRYPRLLALGTQPQPDAESEEIFATLVNRNAINMHSPTHTASVITAADNEAKIRLEIRAALSRIGVTL
jgi:hypothetical protein